MDFNDHESTSFRAVQATCIGSAAPVTAAEAMRLVETWTDLGETRRRDLRSAVSGTVKMCGLPAESVIMVPAFLSPRVVARPPAGYGLSDQRHSAVLSGLRFVLRRLGVHAPFRVAFAPAWEALREQLGHFEQTALAAWFRFATAEGILPSDVEASTIDVFERWARETTLCDDPKKLARRTADAWNRAVAAVPGWPQVRLERAPTRDQYTLPLDAYPPSFSADVEAWTRRAEQVEEEEIFPDDVADRSHGASGRAPRAARPRTIETRVFQIQQAAGALVRSGISPAEIHNLADLVAPKEHPKAILAFMRGRGRERRSTNAGGVGEVLRQLAKFWVRLPDEDVRRIAVWASRIAPERSRSMTLGNRERLRALIEPRTLAKLLHLPIRLEKMARGPDMPARRAAVAMQRAMLVETATICPFRISNLAGLRLDTHLRRADPGSRFYTHIVIEDAEVKNSEPYLWPLPRETALMLDRWITRYRPTLAAPGNPYLFVGEAADGPMSINGLRTTFMTAIEDHVGVKVNLHLMRHFAAWLYLQEHPGDYETVRRALNHKDIKTTNAFYCGLETDAAVRRFDDVVLKKRKATKRLAAAAFRKKRSPRQDRSSAPKARTRPPDKKSGGKTRTDGTDLVGNGILR